MTTMAKELPALPDRDDLIARFLRHCGDVLGVTPEFDRPTEAEQAAIAEAAERLADPDWTQVQRRKLVEMGVKISAGTHLTESTHKAPGGLIRTHLLARDGKVADLMLSGDFTCLPPQGIDDLARALRGTALDEAALTDAAETAIAELNIELPGITPADIARAVQAAASPTD